MIRAIANPPSRPPNKPLTVESPIELNRCCALAFSISHLQLQSIISNLSAYLNANYDVFIFDDHNQPASDNRYDMHYGLVYVTISVWENDACTCSEAPAWS